MISIQNINVNVLTEEDIYSGMVVAEVSASEAATFNIIDGNRDNIVHIDPATGQITLTPDGVDLINADTPDDPTEELSEFTITVQATSLVDGSTDSRDILVGIIRVHDEEPAIIDEVITPLYNEDAIAGLRVLEVRTAYKATFTIMAGNTLVQVPSPIDIGRVVLTSTGAEFVRAPLQPDENRNLEFTLLVHDIENGKEIQKSYSLPVLAGTARDRLPTKNILDLVGENIGAEIGERQAKLFVSLHKINFNSDFYYDKIKEISLIAARGDFKSNRLEEKILNLVDRIDSKINYIKKSLSISLDVIKDQYTDNLMTELNLMASRNNNLHLIQTEQIKDHQRKLDEHEFVIEAIRKATYRYIEYEDDRNALEAELARQALKEYLLSIIEELRNEFEYFRDVTFVNYQNEVDIRFTSAENRLTSLEERATSLEERVTVNEGAIETNRQAIEEVGNRTLEQFDNNNGWDFNSNALQYKQSSILTANGASTTVGTYGGSGNIVIDDSSFGNAGLICKGSEFTGTATKAKYADLAEYYSIDPNGPDIPNGKIVTFSAPHREYEVELADGIKDPIGITSTKPGFILNDPEGKDGKWVAIALAGRVPVIVTNAFEAERGDYLYQDRVNPSIGVCTKHRRESEICLGIVIQRLSENTVEVKVRS